MMPSLKNDPNDSPFALPTEDDISAELARTLATLQADVHRSCRTLTKDASGAKLALLQRLSLKRSSQYAAFYKNSIVAQARTVQRQRADLAKMLQRQARQFLSSKTATTGRDPNHRTPELMFSHVESVLSLLEGTVAVESPRTAVSFALRPPLEALEAFVQGAVMERGLHERVIAALLCGGASSENHEGEGGGGEATRGVDAAARAAAGDAALAEAVSLLFDSIEEAAPDAREPQVRVPVLLSLQQYLADAPWTTTHDALTEDERRRRVKEDPTGDEDPSARVGFLFSVKDVPPSRAAKNGAGSPLLASLSSTASGRGLGRDGGYGGSVSPAAEDYGEGEVETAGLHVDALHRHAQAVAAEISAAVDARWTEPAYEASVEGMTLRLLRQHAQRHQPPVVDVDGPSAAHEVAHTGASPHQSVPSADDVREVRSAEEERQLSTIQEFLDIVRVLYTAEVSSRVLALSIAGKLLKDSEDSICFDGLRIVQLCAHAESNPWLPSHSPSSSSQQQERQQSLGHTDALLPFYVFNMPDTENVFYCLALTLGLALLQDYQGCTTAVKSTSTALDQSPPPQEDEEEALRWAQRGLSETQAHRAKQALAWLNHFEQRYLSPKSPACGFSERGPLDVDVETVKDDTNAVSGTTRSLLLPSLRLWQYLWEHVFSPLAPPVSATAQDRETMPEDETEVVEIVLVREDGTNVPEETRAGAEPAAGDVIPLSRARARRWLEQQVTAALTTGAAHATLIVRRTHDKEGHVAQASPTPLMAATGQRIRKHTMHLWRQTE